MSEKPTCSFCGSSKRVAKYKGGDPLCIKHYLQMYTHGQLFDGNKPKNTNTIVSTDDTCKIITAKGEAILIDKEFLSILSKHSWCLNKDGYAVANIRKRVVRMHRLIMPCNSSHVVDHINGNRLDNRKCNLRLCSAKSNSRNKGLGQNNTSGVPGVSQLPDGRWRARIMVDRKEKSLGYFNEFDDAVKARTAAERKYFGQYSMTASRITASHHSGV